MLERLRLLVQLTRAHRIARRYFVTNGFDGALTMLGLIKRLCERGRRT
jgi:hypothetical protein